MPEDSGKQYPNESCTYKYQKHIACSIAYKLVCVDQYVLVIFSMLKPYLDKDALYNFINSMVEESSCCSDMIKKTILTKSI